MKVLTFTVIAVVLNFLYHPTLDALGEGSEFFSRYRPLFDLLFYAALAVFVLWHPFYQYLYFKTYFYDIDEQNVIIRKGVISKKEITMPFAKITDVYLDRDIGDVILGLYDIYLSTPTAESGLFAHIDGVNKQGSIELRKLILEQVNKKQS